MTDIPPSTNPPRRGAGLVVGGAAVAGFGVVGWAGLVVFDQVQSALGSAVFVYAAVLALVPLGIVVAGIRWLDSWEPEPPGATWFALGFGAAVAVLLALVVDDLIGVRFATSQGMNQFISATVQAPIVEEVGKGLAVLILFWWGRRRIDGPIDGVVYAAWAAAGFAFTENILYFGRALVMADGAILGTFVGRGLMSPFAHLMFTAFVGYFIGRAAERGVRGLALGPFVLGLIPAIALHAFWNGALFFVTSFYTYFFFVQVPLFLGLIAWVAWLRRQKGAVMETHLFHYGKLGWLHSSELAFLTDTGARKQARAWAKSRGVGKEFDQFVRSSARLAFDRHRVTRGLPAQSVAWEQDGLAKIDSARERMRNGLSA
jgi:RsiW-degrading membrane proteinase PrsW (M82 family)